MESTSVVRIEPGWGEHIDTTLKYAWKKHCETGNGSMIVASHNRARIIIVDEDDETIMNAVRARADEIADGIPYVGD